MIDKSSIGKIIKTLRTNKNLTQEELSEKIDISKNYLSKVERGLSVLNVESFLKMAHVLGFSLSDFGINIESSSNKMKNELLNNILSLSDKETEIYAQLLNTTKLIMQNFK